RARSGRRRGPLRSPSPRLGARPPRVHKRPCEHRRTPPSWPYLHFMSLTAVRTTFPSGQRAPMLSLPSSFAANVLRFRPRTSATPFGVEHVDTTTTSHVMGVSQSFLTTKSHTPPPHVLSPVAQGLGSWSGSFVMRRGFGGAGAIGSG